MSLKRKIVLLFLAFSLLIGILGASVFYHEIRQAEPIAKNEALAVAQTISVLVFHEIEKSRTSVLAEARGLQGLVRKLKQTDDRTIVIVDKNKRVIAYAAPAERGPLLLSDPLNEVEQTIRDGRPRTFSEISKAYPNGSKQLVVPLGRDNGERIGAIILEYTPLYRAIQTQTQVTATRFLFLFIGTLAVSFSAAYLFSQRFFRPLEDIQHAARTIASGDMEPRLLKESNDELGSLVRSFNSMTAELKKARDKLLRSNEELELEISERRLVESEYKEMNARLSTLIQAIPDMVFFKDASGRHLLVNRAVEEQTGLLQKELVGKTANEVFPPVAAEACRKSDEKALRQRRSLHFEEEFIAKGESRYIDTIKAPIFDPLGNVVGLVGVSRDITERKRAEKELEAATAKAIEEKNKTEAIISAIGHEISVQDINFRILYQNQLLKDRRGEHTGEYCYAAYHNRDHICEECQLALTLEDGTIHTTERSIPTDNGTAYYEITSSPLRDASGKITGGIELIKNITERKKLEDTITYQANYDFLTGLPNRKMFLDRLNFGLRELRRTQQTLAVMFLDLDRFKTINDTLGHAAGDRLLEDIAERIKSCIRDSDTVARFGGDEFAILLPHIAHREDAIKISDKILSIFREPFVVDGQDLHITASIGISIYPHDGEYAETLLKNADIAMYHAKEQGKNNYQFYNTAMDIGTIERMILENSLRQTLKRGELVVYYQPQVNTQTRHIVCAEALVRWQHPELGLLDPMQFVPLAEEIGFIIPLGEWVLRTACAQNREWQAAGYPPASISVNFSAHQLQQPNLVEMIGQVIQETGLDPRFLELEFTENAAMQNIELITPTLMKLSEMGIRFSIDDFGTGYSSFGYLKKIPVHKLKIDKTFVNNFEKDPDYKTIVKAIIAMAHSLSLSVVAEGVETETQLAFLSSADCDEVQGFIFSEPLPEAEYRKLLNLTGKPFSNVA